MVDIHAHPGGSLPIGRRGENLARRVIFDLAPWRKCYGDGTVQLLHQRAGDADPYPCTLTVEGDMAYWLIRAADVDKPGWGDAQLHYYVGETLAKSSAWRTLTADALGAPGETPPEPQQDWVEKVLAAGTAAEDAAGRAEEAAVHPPYPSEETGTWWTWNAEAGKYEDTGLSYSGSGGGGTTDHTKLTNRNAENQHPMSAITGLVGALNGKVSVADIIDNLTTNAANKPLSAAQGVALKALIDAISIPEKLPNPHALTFTGAVEGSYDGSEAKTINIPSGGASGDYIPVPATAKVGQTIVVKAVDDTGKPTEWEAADMANGGSAGLWEHICDITTTEELDAGIEITKNEAGILLSDLKYNEIFVLAKMVGVSTNTNEWWGCWCYPHQQGGTQSYTRYANGAVSGGTKSNGKYTPYYFFIRGGKMGWTDASNIDPYNINGLNQKWIDNFLDQYNFDYFEKVVIVADSTRVIGVDTEIRVLGRRA